MNRDRELVRLAALLIHRAPGFAEIRDQLPRDLTIGEVSEYLDGIGLLAGCPPGRRRRR